jgi:hypothetical protein
MMSPAKIATSNANRYARYGLPLQQQTLRALEKRGIYCQPSVSIEHQHLAQRYVLRGVESGGAVADMGRYCAYLDADGNPAPWLQQIDSISGNGRHAIVIAPEAGADRDVAHRPHLRTGHHAALAEVRRRPHAPGQSPRRQSSAAIRERSPLELWNAENKSLRGTVAPALLHRSRRRCSICRIASTRQLARSPARSPALDASTRTCRRGSGLEQRR